MLRQSELCGAEGDLEGTFSRGHDTAPRIMQPGVDARCISQETVFLCLFSSSRRAKKIGPERDMADTELHIRGK